VTIWSIPKFTADYPSTLEWEKDFKNISGLPFKFDINNFEDIANDSDKEYSISVKVINGIEDKAHIGDLINEFQTIVSLSNSSVTVKVFGLEDCDTPNAGGFCSSSHRE